MLSVPVGVRLQGKAGGMEPCMGQRGCDCGPVGWDGMGWDRVRWDGMEHGVSGSAGSLHLKIAARRRTVLSHTGTCPWERKAVVLLFLFHTQAPVQL